MKHRRSLIRLCAASLFPLLLGACALFGGKNTGGGGNQAGGGGAETFLATNYKPLREWLDERFPIRYVSMTPQAVFENQPLRELKFETHGLPENAEPLTFESEDISRRELLQKIAEHWNLEMSLLEGSDGRPVAVRVAG